MATAGRSGSGIRPGGRREPGGVGGPGAGRSGPPGGRRRPHGHHRQTRSVPRGKPVYHLGVQVRRAGGIGQARPHFWQRPTTALEADQWSRLPDRLALRPDDVAERLNLLAALRRAVEEQLTDRQRVFTAIVVDGIPVDALVAQLGSSRNAIYKTIFDARRKLRAALAAEGYLAGPSHSPAGWDSVRGS